MPREVTSYWNLDDIMVYKKWEWKREQGVLFPKQLEYATYDREGARTLARTIGLDSLTINKPLASDAFDLRRLGVGEGDRLHDLGLDKLYVVKNGSLVAAAEYNDLGVAEESGGNSHVIYVSAIIVLVAIAFVYYFRRNLHE